MLEKNTEPAKLYCVSSESIKILSQLKLTPFNIHVIYRPQFWYLACLAAEEIYSWSMKLVKYSKTGGTSLHSMTRDVIILHIDCIKLLLSII